MDRESWPARIDDLERRVARIERIVKRMVRADEIANGVAEELDRRARENPLPTRPQVFSNVWARLGALAAGALVVLDAVRGLIS